MRECGKARRPRWSTWVIDPAALRQRIGIGSSRTPCSSSTGFYRSKAGMLHFARSFLEDGYPHGARRSPGSRKVHRRARRLRRSRGRRIFRTSSTSSSGAAPSLQEPLGVLSASLTEQESPYSSPAATRVYPLGRGCGAVHESPRCRPARYVRLFLPVWGLVRFPASDSQGRARGRHPGRLRPELANPLEAIRRAEGRNDCSIHGEDELPDPENPTPERLHSGRGPIAREHSPRPRRGAPRCLPGTPTERYPEPR
jgi:hypothetical protein